MIFSSPALLTFVGSPFLLLSFLRLLPPSFFWVWTTALSIISLATPSVFSLAGCEPFRCEHTGFPYSGSCAPITHVLSTLTLWHRKYHIFPVLVFSAYWNQCDLWVHLLFFNGGIFFEFKVLSFFACFFQHTILTETFSFILQEEEVNILVNEKIHLGYSRKLVIVE